MKKLKARLLLALLSFAIWMFVPWLLDNGWVFIPSSMAVMTFFLYFDQKIDELKI